MKWLLGLIVFAGCASVDDSRNTGKGQTNGTKVGYIDPIYVKTMEHEGREYHIFNSGRCIFVIDVTDKISAEKE